MSFLYSLELAPKVEILSQWCTICDLMKLYTAMCNSTGATMLRGCFAQAAFTVAENEKSCEFLFASRHEIKVEKITLKSFNENIFSSHAAILDQFISSKLKILILNIASKNSLSLEQFAFYSRLINRSMNIKTLSISKFGLLRGFILLISPGILNGLRNLSICEFSFGADIPDPWSYLIEHCTKLKLLKIGDNSDTNHKSNSFIPLLKNALIELDLAHCEVLGWKEVWRAIADISTLQSVNFETKYYVPLPLLIAIIKNNPHLTNFAYILCNPGTSAQSQDCIRADKKHGNLNYSENKRHAKNSDINQLLVECFQFSFQSIAIENCDISSDNIRDIANNNPDLITFNLRSVPHLFPDNQCFQDMLEVCKNLKFVTVGYTPVYQAVAEAAELEPSSV